MGKPVENFAKNDKNPQSFPQGKNDVFSRKKSIFAVFFHNVFRTRLTKATITHSKDHRINVARPRHTMIGRKRWQADAAAACSSFRRGCFHPL